MAKAKYDEWRKLLQKQVDNKSIYLWGGQGETLEQLTDDYIERKETSAQNAKRVKQLRDSRAKKYPKLRAFDCSGLAIWALQKLKIISTDMTANGLMSKCQKIGRGQLRPGDFVFRTYLYGEKRGMAYHIGYVVDGNKIIHAKGRDYGVIKESLTASGTGYWNSYGRPVDLIDTSEEKIIEHFIFDRLLKIKSPMMKGADVENLQTLLKIKGYSPGEIDGIFGKRTDKAVRAFQKKNDLTIDGIAGEKTISALGGYWE